MHSSAPCEITTGISEEWVFGGDVYKRQIQPLVENALLHGMLPTESKGKITVTIEEAEGNIIVMVRDSGQGIADDLSLIHISSCIIYV